MTFTRNDMRLIAVAAALLLAGCNTMQGLGQDVQDLGHSIVKTSDQAQERQTRTPDGYHAQP